jgi:hypothetical protein
VIEQRRTKRFELELPVEVIRTGTERTSALGATRNISSGGILFVSGKALEIGGPIEYVVTLASGANGVVNIRCMGKVLRIQKANAPDEPTAVAASLERYEFQRSGQQEAETEVA